MIASDNNEFMNNVTNDLTTFLNTGKPTTTQSVYKVNNEDNINNSAPLPQYPKERLTSSTSPSQRELKMCNFAIPLVYKSEDPENAWFCFESNRSHLKYH